MKHQRTRLVQPGPQGCPRRLSRAREYDMANGSLQRFVGGSPGAVLVRLIFLSILVGALMAFLDITPFSLINGIVNFFHRVFGRGIDAVREVLQWLIYGAIIVVPIWLIIRLTSGRG
jgi:hypothetical protein